MTGTEIDGRPVFNAKNPMRLTITRNDIINAHRKQPHDCVVAVAARRSTDCKEVRVHLARVYVRSNNSNWQRYVTPKSMRDEIIAYDRGGSFEPGEFVLSVPAVRPSHQGGPEAPGARDKRRPFSKKITPKIVVKNVRNGPA